MTLFYVEIIILVVIALFFQFPSFFKTRSSINGLLNIFPSPSKLKMGYVVLPEDQIASVTVSEVESEMMEYLPEEDIPSGSLGISLLDCEPSEKTDTFRQVLLDTNMYLVRNKNHPTDFKIIKDIVERHCESYDNQVEISLNMPLYFGLLGTIAGVICGVFHLTDIENPEAISYFLISVAGAMSVSGLGLMLTVWNARSYKPALTKMESGRNGFYSFVQAELLPILSKDMASSLATLQDNINRFNRDFQKNLVLFNKSVSAVEDNISLQRDFLEKLDEIGYDQMVTANIRTFREIQKSAEAFEQFRSYQQNLAANLGQMSEGVTVLHQLFNRFRDFEKNAGLMADHFRQQDETYHKLLTVLEDNALEMERRKETFKQFFEELDNEIKLSIRDFFNQLEISIKKNFEVMRDHTLVSAKSMKDLAVEELKNLQMLYDSKKETFEHFSRLEKIEGIMGQMLHAQENGQLKTIGETLVKIQNKPVGSDKVESHLAQQVSVLQQLVTEIGNMNQKLVIQQQKRKTFNFRWFEKLTRLFIKKS